MRLLIAIISGVFVLIYIFTGFDFIGKERFVVTTNSFMFLIFLLSIFSLRELKK